jgi:LacI family transcriptional regulator
MPQSEVPAFRVLRLVVLDVANPFFTDLARGVEDEANKAGLAVILCNSDDQERKEKRYLDLLEQHRVQGVLITPVVGAGTRLARLQRRGTPVVLVDSRSPTRGQCSVAVDDVLGGDLAVSHLLTAGHERIAYIAGPPAIRQVADRNEGALRALRRAGRPGRPGSELTVIQAGSLNVAGGQRAGASIAAMPGSLRPTAARMLLDEAAAGEGHQHRQVIFEPELVVRQSTQLAWLPSRPARARARTASGALVPVTEPAP